MNFNNNIEDSFFDDEVEAKPLDAELFSGLSGYLKKETNKLLKRLPSIKVIKAGKRNTKFTKGTDGVSSGTLQYKERIVTFTFKNTLLSQKQAYIVNKRMKRLSKSHEKAIKKLEILALLQFDDRNNFDLKIKKKFDRKMRLENEKMKTKIRSFNKITIIKSALTSYIAAQMYAPISGIFIIQTITNDNGLQEYTFRLTDRTGTQYLSSDTEYDSIEEIESFISRLNHYIQNDSFVEMDEGYDYNKQIYYYFNIINEDTEILASSAHYSSAALRSMSLQSVRKIVPNASIVYK